VNIDLLCGKFAKDGSRLLAEAGTSAPRRASVLDQRGKVQVSVGRSARRHRNVVMKLPIVLSVESARLRARGQPQSFSAASSAAIETILALSLHRSAVAT
jgi:hypothetical protein